MKAHLNVRSLLSTVTLALCCVALLIPQVATAQTTHDKNGRDLNATPSNASMTRAAEPVRPVDDFTKGCDWDGCTKGRSAEEAQPQTIRGGLDARSITGMPSFQVLSEAPLNSVYVSENGDVGIGTGSPLGRFHVVATPGEGTGDIFLLDNNGNLEIGGLLTEASSVLLKENFVTIDGQDVLDRLATLPIMTWNYKTDDPSIRHMGPMAQDFYAAFGLGKDAEHIAPLDVNGVALAGVQALAQQVKTQATHIATLEQQNAELLQRLEALEALVQRDK